MIESSRQTNIFLNKIIRKKFVDLNYLKNICQ